MSIPLTLVATLVCLLTPGSAEETAAASDGLPVLTTDGALYTVSFGGGLMRFDRDFNKLNFEGLGTNNNPIATFGKYGNEDSGGKNAKVGKPEIPFAWPVYVVASDTHAYVADTVNRRTVRVKLAHAAEETCQVQ